MLCCQVEEMMFTKKLSLTTKNSII